jgi:uncharacterized protein YcbK (DUF882 family)
MEEQESRQSRDGVEGRCSGRPQEEVASNEGELSILVGGSSGTSLAKKDDREIAMEGERPRLKRREVLELLALAILGARSVSATPKRREKRLSIHNTHTAEDLDVVYWSDGDYDKDALKAIDRILRDHRTGEVVSMDRDLLDLLFELRIRLATTEPFHVISGYRSSTSNEYLRGRSPQSGVASKSQHMNAKAVDIRIPGQALEDVRAAAIALKKGGVGFYPESDFVHVDVAKVRYW